jgi:hypothetical protein
MKERNLDAAIRALIREQQSHGEAPANINKLVELLRRQHKDGEARTQDIDVPGDDDPLPKEAA